MVWHAWGSRDSEPLLMLHGGGGSWTHWLRNVEAMAAAGYHVLVPDMPGFGESAKPHGVSDASSMPVPLEAGLTQIIGDQRCAVAAFSFGGIAAGQYINAHPGRVRHLVIAGTPLLGTTFNRLDLKPWRHSASESERLEAHRHNLGSLMLHGPEARSEFALALHAENVERDRMFRRHQRTADSQTVVSILQGVSFPVDVIFGEEDNLYRGHLDTLRTALQTVPKFGSLWLVPGAGHWVQFERAAEFNDLLKAAL